MEIEDELFVEDDLDILEIIDYGFPRRNYEREEYFDLMDNFTFFKRFRLTKQTTLQVLGQVEEQLEFNNDLNNSVSPINQLLASLRFYPCGTHQDAIGDFMGMHQTTASRIIKKVSEAIARLRPAYISMPTGNEIIQVQNDFYQIARFPGVVGCIDGTHIKIKSPGGIDAEIYRNRKSNFSLNAQVICDSKLKIRDIVVRWPGSVHDFTVFNHSRIRVQMEAGEFPNSVLLGRDDAEVFRNRKSYFSINTQVVAGANLRIFDLVARWPGSAHDSTIFNHSRLRARFEAGEFPNVLLGDCGYQLKSYLMTPHGNPFTGPENLNNEAHIRTRNVVDVWKRRFPVLAYGIRCQLDTSMAIIVATAVLQNIAVDMKEDLPTHPAELNLELNYLIAQGDIPHIPLPNIPGPINYRDNLINTYFANL